MAFEFWIPRYPRGAGANTCLLELDARLRTVFLHARVKQPAAKLEPAGLVQPRVIFLIYGAITLFSIFLY